MDPQGHDAQALAAEQTPLASMQEKMALVTGQNIGNVPVNQQVHQVQQVQQVRQGSAVVPNDQLVTAAAAAVESVGTDISKAKKKKDKASDVLCFKCDTTGHFGADCTAILCLLCDSAKHASADCHLHAMPKPVMTMYGLCNDALLFFDIPKSAGVRSKRSSGKEGWIRVTSGELSVHQVIKELNFLVPGNHQWDITPIDNSAFKVVYPTKADYARLRKINDIKVDDTECTIFFEEWATQEVNVWHFREVWVRVRGCPKPLRDDYLGLFAVGALIGKTREVDMAFTREHEIVRMRVLVTNPDAIPDRTEHSYDGQVTCDVPLPASFCKSPVLGLRTKQTNISKCNSASHLSAVMLSTSWADRVEAGEEDLPPPLPMLADSDHPRQDSATDLLPLFFAVADDEVHDEQIAAAEVQGAAPLLLSDGSGLLDHVHGQSRDESPRQEAKARSSPMSETEEVTYAGSPKTRGAGEGSSSLMKLPRLNSPCEKGSKLGTGVFLGCRYSKVELIAFGGIPETQVTGVRSSPRISDQPNSDATQLARARQVAEACNNLSSPGLPV
ncbi:hypothetical protein ACQ4PT_013600 [Festuca glaucescens]